MPQILTQRWKSTPRLASFSCPPFAKDAANSHSRIRRQNTTPNSENIAENLRDLHSKCVKILSLGGSPELAAFRILHFAPKIPLGAACAQYGSQLIRGVVRLHDATG